VREARAALGDGRLVQVQATGLPLAPPFDVLQAIRMQSWSGAAFHGEKNALMAAVARKLGVAPPAPEPEPGSEGGPLFDLRAIALVELVFEYCARHIEFQRRNLAGEMISPSLLEEKRLLFNSLLDLLRQPGSKGHEDDRVGLLEPMIDGFDRE